MDEKERLFYKLDKAFGQFIVTLDGIRDVPPEDVYRYYDVDMFVAWADCNTLLYKIFDEDRMTADAFSVMLKRRMRDAVLKRLKDALHED